MRFMMIVKASKESEAGVMPSEALLAAMGAFNETMVKAGVMLAGEGLQASSKGWRIRHSKGVRSVIDGPFPETEKLVAGFWIIQVNTREEAMEWAMRCPAPQEGGEGEIELRQVFELEDFAPSDAIDLHRELRDKVAKQRETN